MNTLRLSSFLIVLCALLASSPAMAKKKDHAPAHEKRTEITWQDRRHDEARRDYRFRDEDREHTRTYMRAYMRDHAHPFCPPGLAKKHNGCLPPGLSRRYVIGGYLPHDYEPVPQELYGVLAPPPRGTFYVMVDRDVLLATEGTKKILDAITLFSAMR